MSGHSDAQTMEEMLQDMTAAKEKGLSPRRGQSIYKAESGKYQEDKLRELIAGSLEDVAAFATKERVSLENLEDVQQRTVIYLRACLESSTFPSCLGLARSLGYSDRSLRNWRKYKPDTPTARWLEMFNDVCSDILSQAALKNNANSIVSIFLNKADHNPPFLRGMIKAAPGLAHRKRQRRKTHSNYQGGFVWKLYTAPAKKSREES